MENTSLIGPSGTATAHHRGDPVEPHRLPTQETDLPLVYGWLWFLSIAVIVGGALLAAFGGVSVWQLLHSRWAALDMTVALPTIAAGVAAIWIGVLGLVLIEIRHVLRSCHVVTFSLPTVIANRTVPSPSLSTGSQRPQESAPPVQVSCLALALQRLRR